MSTQEVADKLIAYCRQGQYAEAQAELYDEACVSVEPDFSPWPTCRGMDEMRKKGEQWSANVLEVHGGSVSDPLVAGNHITCRMTFDMTFKDRGRSQGEQIALYEVKDGKVVKEQFFYAM